MYTDHFKREDWEDFMEMFPGAIRWQIARNNLREYEHLMKKPEAQRNSYEQNRIKELAWLYNTK